VASRKTESPSTRLTFLAIEMDTQTMTLSLPPSKLEHLPREIFRWESMRSYSKRELLSIIGQLQHACCDSARKVIPVVAYNRALQVCEGVAPPIVLECWFPV